METEPAHSATASAATDSATAKISAESAAAAPDSSSAASIANETAADHSTKMDTVEEVAIAPAAASASTATTSTTPAVVAAAAAAAVPANAAAAAAAAVPTDLDQKQPDFFRTHTNIDSKQANVDQHQANIRAENDLEMGGAGEARGVLDVLRYKKHRLDPILVPLIRKTLVVQPQQPLNFMHTLLGSMLSGEHEPDYSTLKAENVVLKEQVRAVLPVLVGVRIDSW